MIQKGHVPLLLFIIVHINQDEMKSIRQIFVCLNVCVRVCVMTLHRSVACVVVPRHSPISHKFFFSRLVCVNDIVQSAEDMQAFQREESERHEIDDVLRSVEKRLKVPPKVSGRRASRRAAAGLSDSEVDALSGVLALDVGVPRVLQIAMPQDQHSEWPATTRIFSIDGVDGM